MRTLLHLSDLHFGRVDDALLEPLRAFAQALRPDLVIVSGDLTQRARSAQFEQARRFLDTLPRPRIVVPGNHDVPLHNVFSRFARPLDKFHRFITDERQPSYVDAEIGVVGIDTSRSLTFKNGRINERQIEQVRAAFEAMPPQIVRVVVSHHPFDLPDATDTNDLVGRAELAMRAFASCGVDLLLAGHLHVSQVGNTAARYPAAGYAALVVQAGTATSTRGRGEYNSFNVIRIEGLEIEVERIQWQPGTAAFVPAALNRYARTEREWRPMDG